MGYALVERSLVERLSPEGRILKVPLFGHALLRLDYATLNDELMTILLLESLSVIR